MNNCAKTYIDDNNYKELKDIVSKSKNVAIFAGAGSSKLLNIPEWKDLLLEMAYIFNFNNIDATKLDEIIKEKGYPNTAQLIYDSSKDTLRYKEFMRKKMTTALGSSLLHSKIWNIVNKVLTTNFDFALEKALTEKIYTENKISGDIKIPNIQKLPFYDFDKFKENKYSLIYLHGNNDKEEYIFLESEYRLNYKTKYGEISSNLEKLLEEVFTKYSLIFIGFSFDDYYFKEYFIRKIKEFNSRNEFTKNQYLYYTPQYLPEHFIILKENEDPKKIKELEELKLKIIKVKEYGEIENILDSLKDETYLPIQKEEGKPDDAKYKQ